MSGKETKIECNCNTTKKKVKHKVLLDNKKEKAITLIALVITIIVLLILAGVTLNLTLGENGLLKRAQESANAHEQGARNDIAFMNNAYDYMGQYFNSSSSGGEETPEKPEQPFESKLTEEEKEALNNAGIEEMKPSDITNENLKDNENIKGVITGEVPIPEGFDYKEGTKDTGTVITDGESEFVWVPVPDINKMAKLQNGSTENYQGIFYNYTETGREELVIEGVPGSFDTDYGEPGFLEHVGYGDANQPKLDGINDILGTSYKVEWEKNEESFAMAMQNDFNDMVKSVGDFGGFYVGRFELSMDRESGKCFSKKGIKPEQPTSSNGGWWSMYAYQKKMSQNEGYNGLQSYMMWSCNWDAIMLWIIDTCGYDVVRTSGNAYHDLKSYLRATGTTYLEKTDIFNNIYDLEGNASEFTCAASSNRYRVIRGGSWYPEGVACQRSSTYGMGPTVTSKGAVSSRSILYFK